MRWRCWLLILIFATPVHGQGLPIRSGEHAGYSRLVIDFAVLPDWSLVRSEAGYRLTTGDGVLLDAKQVFDTMPRSRISDVVALREPSGLEITLACDPCHADAFVVRDSSLVIDIRDGLPPNESPFEASADAAPGATQSEDSGFEIFYPEDDRRAFNGPEIAGAVLPKSWLGPVPQAGRFSPAVPVSRDPRYLLEKKVAGTASRVHTDFSAISPRSGATLATGAEAGAAADQLALDRLVPPAGSVSFIAQGLSAASSQGLVELDGPVQRQASQEPVFQRAQESIAGTTEAPDANIRVRTSIEQDNQRLSFVDGRDGNRPQCPPSRLFDVSLWGDEDRVGGDLSTFRQGLADEFDEPASADVTALARHYLYLTFGVEAASVINAYPGVVESESTLLALAAIMDDTANAQSISLIRHIDCNGLTALWALLGAEDPSEVTDYPTDAALAAFTGLPLHIRRALAPRFADRLDAMGYSSASRRAIEQVLRAPGEHGKSVELAAALRDNGAAGQDLRRFSAADPVTAARSMRQMVRTQLDNGEPVSANDVLTLSTLAFELGPSPLSDDLKRLEIESLARTAQVDRSVDVLLHEMEAGRFEKSVMRALLSVIMDAALLAGSDADLLMATARLSPVFERVTLPSAMQIRVGTRLLDLGFDQFAMDVVSAETRNSEHFRGAMAGFYLRNGLVDAAVGELSQLQSRQPSIIAELDSLRRRHEAASKGFEAAGDAPRAVAEAILSEDWGLYAQITGETPWGGSDTEDDLDLQEVSELAIRNAARARQSINNILNFSNTPVTGEN